MYMYMYWYIKIVNLGYLLVNHFHFSHKLFSLTQNFSPEANFDYIITALGYTANELQGGRGTSSFETSAGTAGMVAVDEGVVRSLVSQVKEVLSHLGDGFIRVRSSWIPLCHQYLHSVLL